ncbi:MAG: hypothetical protein KC417_07390, partial [Myxococcales bacterium]|nr:hypothetical protein [Myxococcales bacterium]
MRLTTLNLARLLSLGTLAVSLAAPISARAACIDGAPDTDIDPSEECDDGNQIDDDGCSNECTVNPGWVCAPPVTLENIDVQGPGTDANWTIAVDGLSGKQTVNTSSATIGYLPEADGFAAIYTFDIEVQETGDDDFIGFVL